MRPVIVMLALACSAGCKKDSGSWSRSQYELCTAVDELHRDYRSTLDSAVDMLARLPAQERTREQCELATQNMSRLSGQLFGFHQAAMTIDLGRPESAEPISTLLPTSVESVGLCTSDLTKADAVVRDLERKGDNQLTGALAQCTKLGWKSILDPLPPLPAQK